MEDAGSRWGDSYLCQASSIESIKAEMRGGELNGKYKAVAVVHFG
jgi:hypothetical protein